MPVPWEALIPFGLLTAMFGTAGTLLGGIQRAQNLGKPARYSVDNWDEVMMNRDELLTGHRRGQTSAAVAPPEFATSKPFTPSLLPESRRQELYSSEYRGLTGVDNLLLAGARSAAAFAPSTL